MTARRMTAGMNMKVPLNTVASLLAVAALTAACKPSGSGSSTGSSNGNATPSASAQDPRFYEFTVSSENKPVFGEDTDYLDHRMPNLRASEGHYAQILIADSGWIPAPETNFWFSGVAVVSEETITQLQEQIEGSARLLPGIHPDLHQYVPQGCEFETVPADRANTILDTAAHSYPNGTDSFSVTELAVSPGCHLVVVTAEGVNG